MIDGERREKIRIKVDYEPPENVDDVAAVCLICGYDFILVPGWLGEIYRESRTSPPELDRLAICNQCRDLPRAKAFLRNFGNYFDVWATVPAHDRQLVDTMQDATAVLYAITRLIKGDELNTQHHITESDTITKTEGPAGDGQ